MAAQSGVTMTVTNKRQITKCYAIPTNHSLSLLVKARFLHFIPLKYFRSIPIGGLGGMLLHSLPWNGSLAYKNVDQPLQWLHILSAEQVVVHCDGDKMYEAAIELQVPIDVPEWVLPMTVVEVRIATKHLLDDASDVRVEIGGEAGGFADPVILLA
jgi:hypothetical protein